MKKRIATVIVMLITFSLVVATVSASVMMSVYSTSVSFTNYYGGATRSYTGSSSSEDMNWKGTTHTIDQTSSMSSTFTISLYRERKFLPDQLIGQVVCDREGYHNITWTSVGAGNYYFYYSKDNDGATVYSNDVILSMS